MAPAPHSGQLLRGPFSKEPWLMVLLQRPGATSSCAHANGLMHPVPQHRTFLTITVTCDTMTGRKGLLCSQFEGWICHDRGQCRHTVITQSGRRERWVPTDADGCQMPMDADGCRRMLTDADGCRMPTDVFLFHSPPFYSAQDPSPGNCAARVQYAPSHLSEASLERLSLTCPEVCIR